MTAVEPTPILQGPVWQKHLRPLAAALLRKVDTIADEVTAQIHAAMPEVANDPDLAGETRSTAAATCMLGLSMVCDGISSELGVEPPPAALEEAKQYARVDADAAVLLRAYRIGHAWFWEMWSSMLRQRIADRLELAEAIAQSSRFLFLYIDHASSRVVQVYTEERERWVRSAAARRAESVRAILDGANINLAAASRRLRYDLSNDHLAFVVWSDPTDDERGVLLEERAARVAAALGARTSLLVPMGRVMVAGWIPARSAAPDAVRVSLADDEASPCIRAAVGAPAAGIDGFRQSHQQALHARRVADLIGLRASGVLRFEDIAVKALATSDPQLARWFVHRELGELAEPSPMSDRLTATLEIYLAEGASHAKAARRLHVHDNTIAYRVRQAETMIGHPVDQRRLEVSLALHLREVLPGLGPA